MPTAACYLRVSTDRQTAENQRAEVAALAQRHGYEVRWFEDQESAVKARPGFAAMLAAARAGEVTCVVFWALDRLHRNMAASVACFSELARLNVRTLSCREAFCDRTGPERDLLVAIFSWLAEQERRRLIERTNAGLARARAEGKRLGRPPASPIMLSVAAEQVRGGLSVRAAAAAASVGESTLRRWLASHPVVPPQSPEVSA